MVTITEPGVFWTPVDPAANIRIPSCMYWSISKPLEITVIFGQVKEDYDTTELAFIRWVFSRDLVTEAARDGVAGLGDVQIEIDSAARLTLRLESPTGIIRLRTEAGTILKFVQRTFREVDEDIEFDMLPLSDDALREAMLDWGLM